MLHDAKQNFVTVREVAPKAELLVKNVDLHLRLPLGYYFCCIW